VRRLLAAALLVALAAGSAWWLYGADGREITVFGETRSLPRLGWGTWTMFGSLALLLPLILLLRGSGQRYNVLQKCLLISVLIHVLGCFALSSVIVTQQVAVYVKQETGVDLSLSLPRSVELALDLRHPRSSEGPQATAPRELAPKLSVMQQPHPPAAMPPDVPLDSAVSGRGSALSIAPPPLASTPAAPMPAIPSLAIAPAIAPPNVTAMNLPMPQPLRQQEVEPRVSSAGPEPLKQSGVETPVLRPDDSALSVGPEKAPDHLDALSAPAPLPQPAISAPPLLAGVSAAAPTAPGPRISTAPSLFPKIGGASSSPLLSAPEPGEGNDAELGRSTQGGAGAAGVRFAPVQSGPAELAGSIGSGMDAVPAAAPPQVAISLAPPMIPKVAEEIMLPKVPMIPPPPVAPTTRPQQLVADTPFQRAPEQRQGRIAKLGGSPKSEEAVEHALKFLARQQEPDGRWTLVQDESLPGKRRAGSHDMAYTGLALLTFLAHDQSPLAPGPYRDVLRKGVNYLLSNQSPDGDLRGPPEFRGGASQQANMYDHAIAMLAISESALLSGDPRLRSSALAAAQFIVNAQDRDGGGWRYAPGQRGDTSVFGWEIMALHSAELLGFKVPAETRRLARRYIDDACGGNGGVIAGYQPGVDPTQTMTGEMLFARMLLGEHFSDAVVMNATAFLADYPPDAAHPDLYCWYYASLCMLQMNSPAWPDWNARTRDALIQLQTRGGFADGCWEVTAKGIDRSGYIFTTAIATLTLEVYYRYAPGLAEAPAP
jgi:hypothetical protein